MALQCQIAFQTPFSGRVIMLFHFSMASLTLLAERLNLSVSEWVVLRNRLLKKLI
jgi:hypothetical protein